MKKNNKKIGMQNLKFMIASVSVTATLALWGMFSTEDQKGNVLQIEVSKTLFVADLLPIPTVVPRIYTDAAVDQSTNMDFIEIRTVNQPEVSFAQAPGSGSGPEVIIVSGNNNSSGGGSNTSTSSS